MRQQVFSLLSYVCFALFTRYGGGRHVIYITDSYLLQVVSYEHEASTISKSAY